MVTTLYDSFLFFIGGNGDVENIEKDNQTISFEYRKRKYIYIYMTRMILFILELFNSQYILIQKI